MSEEYPIMDATIRSCLTEKVREKFPEDYVLLEPVIENLVAHYSLKELYMVCHLK